MPRKLGALLLATGELTLKNSQISVVFFYLNLKLYDSTIFPTSGLFCQNSPINLEIRRFARLFSPQTLVYGLNRRASLSYVIFKLLLKDIIPSARYISSNGGFQFSPPYFCGFLAKFLEILFTVFLLGL